MKESIVTFLCMFYLAQVFAQKEVFLPYDQPKEIEWQGGEHRYFSKKWNTQLITNISKPSMLVYKPKKNTSGVAVVIAPGGGLHANSINSEGIDVAKWLVKKGITAFVLKYRLIPTKMNDSIKKVGPIAIPNLANTVEKMIPYSIADGLSAIKYVRHNAEEFGIDTQKIGFMGFSAGGAVAMGVSYHYDQDSKPNFLTPIYPWTTKYPVQKAPKNAPPILVICASDDPLGLAPGSIALYNSWLQAGHSASLIMYPKGGHGFGMRPSEWSTSHWIARFYDWLADEDFATR